MLAYLNDSTVKEKYLFRVRAHREADELVKGQYWARGKGCAVGCTIHGSDHRKYETELGIPEILARLEDAMFENLDNGKAQAWPERFLAAIEAGADLSMVWPRFALWLLVDPEAGVLQFAGGREDVRKAIEGVAALYRRWVETGTRPAQEKFAAWTARAAWAAQWVRMSEKLVELLQEAGKVEVMAS